MPTYIAKRSFFGDLGSVRRRQILTIGDDRLAEQLTKGGLIAQHAAPAIGESHADEDETNSSAETSPTQKPKAKPKGKA